MMRRCCECQHKRERCRAAVRHVNGAIDFVCLKCWKKLDYDDFMRKDES